MNSCLRTIRVCLLAGAASLGCSAGAVPEVAGDEPDVPEAVSSVEQGVDQACINQCMRSCVCTPDDGKPAVCRRMCLADCTDACAPQTCTPSWAGKPAVHPTAVAGRAAPAIPHQVRALRHLGARHGSRRRKQRRALVSDQLAGFHEYADHVQRVRLSLARRSSAAARPDLHWRKHRALQYGEYPAEARAAVAGLRRVVDDRGPNNAIVELDESDNLTNGGVLLP